MGDDTKDSDDAEGERANYSGEEGIFLLYDKAIK